MPRRFVDSSMSAPMYVAGVTTDSWTHGSRISSMSLTGGSFDGLSTRTGAAAVDQQHLVLDRRRGRDQVEAELPLEALLDDLHVQQAEEAAPEPEAERDGALGLERERGVVEVELLDRVAEERVVLAADRVDAGEDEALGLLVAGQRLGRGARRRR